MWTRTVETAVSLCRFAKRGSADGLVAPATDGSAPVFPVFGESVDADLQIAAGKTVSIVTDLSDREFFLIAGAPITEFQNLTSDGNAAAVAAGPGNCVGAQALESAASAGQIIRCRPAQIIMPGSLSITPPISIADGGTGATTAAAACSALGLGAAALLADPVPVANGGTGSATASDARTALGLGAAALASKAANQPASVATDAAGVVADLNTLLAALKTAGLMVADS